MQRARQEEEEAERPVPHYVLKSLMVGWEGKEEERLQSMC